MTTERSAIKQEREQVERDRQLLMDERAAFEREKRQYEADRACGEEK